MIVKILPNCMFDFCLPAVGKPLPAKSLPCTETVVIQLSDLVKAGAIQIDTTTTDWYFIPEEYEVVSADED